MLKYFMALSKDQKSKIIEEFKIHEKDVGSPEVQIALLTEEIKRLTSHLKEHPHDNTSKRGLILKVAQRRKILKYLKRISVYRYKKVVEKLGL
jgi:small subunit ribosomal protein S15